VLPQGGRKHQTRIFCRLTRPHSCFHCGGAFSGLEKSSKTGQKPQASGLRGGRAKITRIDRSIQRSRAGGFDLFGLIPELVGRMPVVATLAELSEDALVVTEPKMRWSSSSANFGDGGC
jgi:ATP-dependent Clp protease ATP-binding subunit ClpX